MGKKKSNEQQSGILTSTCSTTELKECPTNEEIATGSAFVQKGVAQKMLRLANVTFLDGNINPFYVHKNATGEILINLVCNHLNLKERDFFSLAFFEEDEQIQHWLYPGKKIRKQLRDLPWKFYFRIKFYPPQPSQLSEDLTRHLLCLQLQNDIYSERLPASFVTQLKLGALITQAKFGDYSCSDDYVNYLKNSKIVPVSSDSYVDKVTELHKQHRGLTKNEAELAFLNECKDIVLYGVALFPAKDSKGKCVQIGVNAHGISIYADQVRIYRFAWSSIIKFLYRRNAFSIKLKPGELEKKGTSVSYKFDDYVAAKRLWKCAVEHHTFFRLIQPEAKSKKFFRFGSSRFRYQGRTNFQAQMASQLIENSGNDQSLSNPDRIVPNGAEQHNNISSNDQHHLSDNTNTESNENALKGNENKANATNSHQNVGGVDISSSSSSSSSSTTSDVSREIILNSTDNENEKENQNELSSPQQALNNGTEQIDYGNTPGVGKLQLQHSNGFTKNNVLSMKAVTTGNRTVETCVYKMEENDLIKTHTEHRITYHSTENNDYDEELTRAIFETTKMDPGITVEKVGQVKSH